MNKGRPFRTSGGIPFIMKYPAKVPKGKIVHSALTTVDFMPSILSLMNVEHHGLELDGTDFSKEVTNSFAETNYPRKRFMFDPSKQGHWAGVLMRNYRLIVSKGDIPWLFDLDADPFEVYNYFDDPKYASVQESLLDALFVAMEEYNFPITSRTRYMYWSIPACIDSRDRIEISSAFYTCEDIGKEALPFDKCSSDAALRDHCPVTCESCCKDSEGVMWADGMLRTCDRLRFKCGNWKISKFCPQTCGTCTASDNIFG